MASQPTGTVTLLFTDIEGSTRLLGRLGGDAYAQALDLHRRLLRESCERHGGYEVDAEGDAFLVAFARAEDALAAAGEGQRALAAAAWREGAEIRVRMGVHTGEPRVVPPKYVGLDVHRAARIMAAAHGGQVLPTRGLLGDGISVRDLRAHTLKDLSAPQHLFQLLLDGLQTEFPPLRTLGERPTNLPTPATAFVGRARELADAAVLLGRDEVRILTFTGPGGTGKTRLALQVAAESADAFPDGVWWIPLASLGDPMLFFQALAQVLQVREQSGRVLRESVVERLAGRASLLLLDNAEHLNVASIEWIPRVVADRDPELAARLLGYGAALGRLHSFALAPEEEQRLRHTSEDLRRRLGDETFENCRQEGATLTFDDLIEAYRDAVRSPERTS